MIRMTIRFAIAALVALAILEGTRADGPAACDPRDAPCGTAQSQSGNAAGAGSTESRSGDASSPALEDNGAAAGEPRRESFTMSNSLPADVCADTDNTRAGNPGCESVHEGWQPGGG